MTAGRAAAYGGLLVAVGALVLTGAVQPDSPVDETALRWHVAVWDLWFLVWGLLIAAAGEARRRSLHSASGTPPALARRGGGRR